MVSCCSSKEILLFMVLICFFFSAHRAHATQKRKREVSEDKATYPVDEGETKLLYGKKTKRGVRSNDVGYYNFSGKEEQE